MIKIVQIDTFFFFWREGGVLWRLQPSSIISYSYSTHPRLKHETSSFTTKGVATGLNLVVKTHTKCDRQ